MIDKLFNLLLNWIAHYFGWVPKCLNFSTGFYKREAVHEVEDKIQDWQDEALEKAQEPAVKATTHQNAQGKVGQSKSPLSN